MTSTLQIPHGKVSGAVRRDDLRSEIALLIKERQRVREELDSLRVESAQYSDTKALADENVELKAENDSLRATLAEIDRADYARLKKEEAERLKAEQGEWADFLRRCESARLANPDFDACVQVIGDIPISWVRTLAGLPNGPEVIMFLGRTPKVRVALSELKDSAAIARLIHASFELRQIGR